MGIKKRLLAMGIAATTLLGTLTACGAQEAAPADGGSATEATTEKAEADSAETTEASSDGDAAQAAIDARKAAAQESGEYQKVVVSFFDWTGAPAGIDRVNEAISEHTRETLGLDVELLIIDSAAYTDDIKLMLSSGEQVDLFSTCGPGYMTCVNNGYTADLEENDLLATYGKELNELMSKLNCDLEFKYHKEVNVMSVKMIDKKTDEVIKEYPPEEMVEGMIRAQEWLGAFLDRNA